MKEAPGKSRGRNATGRCRDPLRGNLVGTGFRVSGFYVVPERVIALGRTIENTTRRSDGEPPQASGSGERSEPVSARAGGPGPSGPRELEGAPTGATGNERRCGAGRGGRPIPCTYGKVIQGAAISGGSGLLARSGGVRR